MTFLGSLRIRNLIPLAALAMLALGLAGCIDTTKMASPKITPPQESTLEHPTGTSTPPTSTEIMDETNLVHNVTFHRAMYARYLRVLAAYYSEQGFPEKSAWAQTELRSFQRVKTYQYLSDGEATRAQVRPTSSDSDLVVRPAVWMQEPAEDAAPKAEPEAKQPPEQPGSLEHPAGVETPDIPYKSMGEADLVENLTLHRSLYTQFLTALTTYYSERGYTEKAAWAQTELTGLRRVKAYKYIMDAEVPVAELKPMDSIAEADKLYEEGMKLLYKGGRGFPCFYNQGTMRLALVKLKELVDKYPTSDKIDDAAYYIGEIHKEYEKEHDNGLAIEWYKRAIQWNPNTPHPCRFRIATTYDYRLHEREMALYWYQKTIEEESKYTSHDDVDFAGNVKYARARVRELTPEEHRVSPAEALPGGQPSPSPAPEISEPVPAPPSGR